MRRACQSLWERLGRASSDELGAFSGSLGVAASLARHGPWRTPWRFGFESWAVVLSSPATCLQGVALRDTPTSHRMWFGALVGPGSCMQGMASRFALWLCKPCGLSCANALQ